MLFVGVFLLALTNRMVPVLRGSGLAGVLGYDDGVYYAGAVGLVHGRLPYRDFLLLHPPGALLALAPVAGLGQRVGETTAWELSRLVWMVMGGATAVLVTASLMPLGRLAACVGGCVYAVFPGAVLVERTTLLEGLSNICLAAAVALVLRGFVARSPGPASSRARVVAGALAVGALLGFATAVKIWGVVPLAVVCAFVAVSSGIRRGLLIAVGGVTAATLACLPFFLAAPAAMWRMVVLDQTGRDRSDGLVRRAAEIATMGRLAGSGLDWAAAIATPAALAGSLVVVWKCTAFRLVVPLTAGQVVLLLAAPTFFPHYLGVVAVPAALFAGVLARAVAFRGKRQILAILGGLVLAADGLALAWIRSGESTPAELTVAVEPAPGCVTADDSNHLLALGVLGRNLERGCELVVDLGGHSHDLSRGTAISRARNAAWQQLALRYLGSGHYALVTRFDHGNGFSARTQATIDSWPVRLEVQGYALRQPLR